MNGQKQERFPNIMAVVVVAPPGLDHVSAQSVARCRYRSSEVISTCVRLHGPEPQPACRTGRGLSHVPRAVPDGLGVDRRSEVVAQRHHEENCRESNEHDTGHVNQAVAEQRRIPRGSALTESQQRCR